MKEILMHLKRLGVDYEKASGAYEDKDEYVEAVRVFFCSLDFMRLGYAINRKQWQGAAAKAMKMSKTARELGCVGIEKQMTGIRLNINNRNSEEALQLLSVIISKRVRIIEYFQTNAKEK